MRLAVIDIGSNTIKMTVFSANPHLNEIFSRTVHARLSTHIENGRLTECGMRILSSSVNSLKRSAKNYLCKKQNIFAFATACVRGAINRNEIIQRAQKATKINIDLLSGDKEAELCFKGAISSGDFPRTGVLADLGGGSCEFISFDGKKALGKESLNIGALANYKRFARGEYITPSELKTLSKHLDSEISSLEGKVTMPVDGELVLTGGSARALVKLISAIREDSPKLPYEISKTEAEEICQKCASGELIPFAEKNVKERAKTLACAVAVFVSASNAFGKESFTVVSGGARQGYASDLMNEKGKISMEININKNEEKRVIFEGMISFRSVVSAIRDGRSDRKIIAVYFDTAKKQKLSRHLSYVKAMSHELSFPLYFAENDEIDALCEGSSHGGIVTVCTDRDYAELTSVNQLKKDGFYVILDGIEDPYNFAFSVRAAYAAGADGLILPPHNWLSAAGNVCRSSAGASELIDVFTIGEKSINTLKKAGYKIVCTDTENAVSLEDSDLSRPLAVVIGGERRGISKNILLAADKTVRIDYGRDFSEALPAASASAIICFEVLRRNS